MSYNRSPLAFDDIRGAFERALASPKGIRISCATWGAAVVLRSRFNYLRKLDREANKKTFEVDHPLWNRSVYDKLVLRIPPKGDKEESMLYIEKRDVEDLNIEEIE
jgi:hypothetical protein